MEWDLEGESKCQAWAGTSRLGWKEEAGRSGFGVRMEIEQSGRTRWGSRPWTESGTWQNGEASCFRGERHIQKNHEIREKPPSSPLFSGTHPAKICLAQSISASQALLNGPSWAPPPGLPVPHSSGSPGPEKLHWPLKARNPPACSLPNLSPWLFALGAKTSHFSCLIFCLPSMAGGGGGWGGDSQHPRLEGNPSIKEEGGDGWGDREGVRVGRSPLEGC